MNDGWVLGGVTAYVLSGSCTPLESPHEGALSKGFRAEGKGIRTLGSDFCAPVLALVRLNPGGCARRVPVVAEPPLSCIF